MECSSQSQPSLGGLIEWDQGTLYGEGAAINFYVIESNTYSLCWPRLMAASYRKGDVVATAACNDGGLVLCSFVDRAHSQPLGGVVLNMSSSCAVTFCGTEN